MIVLKHPARDTEFIRRHSWAPTVRIMLRGFSVSEWLTISGSERLASDAPSRKLRQLISSAAVRNRCREIADRAKNMDPAIRGVQVD